MSYHKYAKQQEELQSSDGTKERRKSYVDKRHEKILAIWADPVWSKLSTTLIISMMVLTIAMSLTELSSWLPYASSLGTAHLLTNLATTGLWIWGIHCLLLIPVCLMGCRYNRNDFNRSKAFGGSVDTTDAQRARSRRAIVKLNAIYRRYILIGLIGLGTWLLFFLCTRIF